MSEAKPVLYTVVSWFFVIVAILVGKDNRILYFYMGVTFLASLLINSLVYKIFVVRSVGYDYVVYHYICSISHSVGMVLATLRLAPYHRVYRSLTKMFLLVPCAPFRGCDYRTEIVEDVPVRVYSPAELKSDVVLVYFHGGMFCYYNQRMYHNLMYKLAVSCGCKVVLCGQKLAPEFPFPNAAIEAYQIVNWVQSNDVSLGINKKRVVVVGDGSGGALAATVALLHKDNQGKSLLEEHADLQPPLSAQILISPVLQGFSYGENTSINPCTKVSSDKKSRFLSYYLTGDSSLTSILGDQEGCGEYPAFWKALIDDAVQAGTPVSQLRRCRGVWNKYAFPLMCDDPVSLPDTLVIGYIEDDSFDDARYYSEWLQHNQVRVKFVRELSGYHGNLLLHGISASAAKALQIVADYVEETIC